MAIAADAQVCREDWALPLRRSNMASAGVVVGSDEIVCPVCFEEFDEPKCLPGCAHNVCFQCLERMAQTNSTEISCPVCRKGSTIPPNGVAGFPKNHLLASLVDRIPGRREKQMVTKVLKKCNEESEEAKKCLTEMKGRFEAAQGKAEETRREIRSLARRVVERVQEQERDLLAQVDGYMDEHFSLEAYKMHEKILEGVIATRSKTSKLIGQKLSQDDVDGLRDFQAKVVPIFEKSSEASATKIQTAERSFKAPAAFTLSEPSESVENFVKGGFIAKLHKGIDFSNCGRFLWSIEEDDVGDYDFQPFAVAVSNTTGNLAILDESKRRVHVVNILGQKQSKHIHIQHGDLWDVAFNNDDEVVVTNREKTRLLHYRNGKFVKKIFSVLPSLDFSFTFLSIDSEGRYILTSKDVRRAFDMDVGVCVYTADRQLQLDFGTDVLLSPGRAVSYKNNFFVPDSLKHSIVVFNEHGLFSHEIGKSILKGPVDLAIDPVNNSILVVDCDLTVKIFSITGTFLFKFSTASSGLPRKIALSKHGDKIILAFDYAVSMFSYLSI